MCCTTPEDGLRKRKKDAAYVGFGLGKLRELGLGEWKPWEKCTDGLPLHVPEGSCEGFLEPTAKYLYFDEEREKFKANVFHALRAALSGKEGEGRLIEGGQMKELVGKAAEEARAQYVLQRVWETVSATKIDVPSEDVAGIDKQRRACSDGTNPHGQQYVGGYTRKGPERRLSYAEGGEGRMVVTVETAAGKTTFQVPGLTDKGVEKGPNQKDKVDAEAQEVAESAAASFCAAVSKDLDTKKLVHLQELVKNLEQNLKEAESMMKEGFEEGRKAALKQLVPFRQYFWDKYGELP